MATPSYNSSYQRLPQPLNGSSQYLQNHTESQCLYSGHLPTTALWMPSPWGYLVPSYTYYGHQSPLSSSPLSQFESTFTTNSDWWIRKFNTTNSEVPSGLNHQDLTKVEGNPQIILKQEEDQLKSETVERQILDLKKTKKLKKKSNDKDYMPHKPQKKDVRKRLHQNENRNVIPNEINQIISFLQKRTKSGAILTKLWKKWAPEDENWSMERFYLYQNLMKEKVGHYSNEASLRLLAQLYEPDCRVWPQAQQRHYIRLSRMLVGHFLREDSIFIILTSKRMKSCKKLQHLRARRQVTRRVLQLLNGN